MLEMQPLMGAKDFSFYAEVISRYLDAVLNGYPDGTVWTDSLTNVRLVTVYPSFSEIPLFHTLNSSSFFTFPMF
jgi:hypothetical protein